MLCRSENFVPIHDGLRTLLCSGPLVEVGVQGFIFAVLEPDTLSLLAERVIPVLSAVPQTV